MHRDLKTPTKLRVPFSESCQDTELNERALMVSKDMYNRCIDYTTENARLAEISKQQASKLAKLKAASHEMSKDWNDALRNIQRKRREELAWKRDRTEKSMLKFVKDMKERNTVQQAKIVKEARQLLFHKQPHCRIINSALLTSEAYRELNAQLAFRKKLENLDKQQDDAYADLLKNDTEKFFEEKEQKAKDRLEKTRIYAALLKKQIEDTSNNLKNIELIEARADAEDLDNMQKEEKMIKQCETEQMLEEKKKWKQIFLNQLEEKKSLEKKMEQEENLQNSYVAACRSAKEQANRITKIKRKEAYDNKIAYCEKIAKKCAIAYQTNEAAEDERIQRAVAEKDELEKAREERDRQFREKMQNDIKRYAAEAAALREKHEREEKLLLEWETKQRYKRDAYNKEIEMKIAMEEKRKKEETAKYLRKQMADQKNLQEKDRIMDDDSEAVQRVIQNTNERILAYGQEVLKESEGVRPLFPIIKVIENFRKENMLFPTKSVEESESRQPKRRMKKIYVNPLSTDQSFCQG